MAIHIVIHQRHYMTNLLCKVVLHDPRPFFLVTLEHFSFPLSPLHIQCMHPPTNIHHIKFQNAIC